MVNLRSVKSDQELACLKSAFEIAEDAIGIILDELKPGMTELEVVGIAQKAIYERGAEYEGMPQYVFCGRNTTHAISRPTHKTIEPGEMIQLNISARVGGYSSGVGRPVVIGKMNSAQRKLAEFARDAHEQVMEWLQPGIRASEVAEKYVRFFEERGHKENFLYGPCHGLGMIEVEPPWMEVTSDYLLQKNMCFNVDTFAFRQGEFGLRWENGIAISDGGVNRFSSKYMDILEL